MYTDKTASIMFQIFLFFPASNGVNAVSLSGRFSCEQGQSFQNNDLHTRDRSVTSKARQGIPDALCRLPVKGPHSDLNRAASKCTAHDRHLKGKHWECSVSTMYVSTDLRRVKQPVSTSGVCASYLFSGQISAETSLDQIQSNTIQPIVLYTLVIAVLVEFSSASSGVVWLVRVPTNRSPSPRVTR